MNNRRTTVGICAAAAVLAASLTACGSSGGDSSSAGASSDAPTTVKVSYASAVGNEIPTWIAEEEGIFAKNGINVPNLQMIPASNGVAAVISGGVDVADVGGGETLSAAAQGGNVKVVATLMPVFNWKFYVKPTITSIAQLKGKKLGITKPGAGFDVGLRLALPKMGLSPKDVTFIPTGGIANVTAALIGGSIDGAPIIIGPDSLKLEEAGFKPIFDFADIGLPTVNSCIIVGGDLANKPKVLQHYVDSIVQAIAYEKSNPEGTKKVIAKYFKTSDPALINYTYDYYSKVVPTIPTVSADQFADSQRILGQTAPKVANYDLTKLIDDSFVKNAVSNAGPSVTPTK